MDRLIYILAYPLLWLIMRLPISLLYVISDFVYVILYRLIGYRKNVVRENLELVFPDKDISEYRRIEKAFYKHFCDLFFEMIYYSRLSQQEQEKHITITNPELLKKYNDRSIMCLSGHYANWEWLANLDYISHHQMCAVYTKIQNKYFNRLIKKSRKGSRDVKLFERSEATKVMYSNYKNGIYVWYMFVSDQSPMLHQKRNYWRNFMDIPVPCFSGYDSLARKLDLVLIYCNSIKLKRGHYQVTLDLITDDAKSKPKNAIIDCFYERLENQIRDQPEYYLWTHRRWKHRHYVKEKASHLLEEKKPSAEIN